MKDPFRIIFYQQLGSASCTLLACHFSSWPVFLQSRFGAGTRVPVPSHGLPAGRSNLFLTRDSPDPAMRSSERVQDPNLSRADPQLGQGLV